MRIDEHADGRHAPATVPSHSSIDPFTGTPLRMAAKGTCGLRGTYAGDVPGEGVTR